MLIGRIEVPGKAAHGSLRDAGVSAIDAYLPIREALIRLEAVRNADPDPLMAEYPIPYALSVGTPRAGGWASSVPDLLVAEGRLGVRLDEASEAARADFERCVADACAADPWLRDHPAVVTWHGGQFASGRLPAAHPLRMLVQDAHADVTGGPYGSDLRLYSAVGIPTLQFGPGDLNLAHGPREQVSVPEIVEVTRALVLAVLRTVGTK
ncbi:MAG: acetylornithine deacetylase [Streptomycetaceae bacterium]|jgi:acetylornithine deacetylase|nr:acetylornithine deacetylase [Streptomycetaceae bacterium]